MVKKRLPSRKGLLLFSIFVIALLLIGVSIFGFMTKFTFSMENYHLLKDKDYALVQAVKENNFKNVEFLVHNGANVNFLNKDGDSPIKEAIKLGNRKIIHSLVSSSNANVQQIDKNQNNVLQATLTFQPQDTELIKELSKLDIDLYKENRDGQNTYETAILTQNIEIMRELVPLGLNLNKIDDEGNNALHVLLNNEKENPAFLKGLIQEGAEVNGYNDQGYAPLYIAIKTNKKDSVDVLLSNKADPYSVTRDGLTAIEVAEKDNEALIGLFSKYQLVIKMDKAKSTFVINSITLGAKQEEIMKRLGEPLRTGISDMDAFEYSAYPFKDHESGQELELEIQFNAHRQVHSIIFELENNISQEKWYKDLGEPFTHQFNTIYYYLEGTEQLLMFKPEEGYGYLMYADNNFYFHQGMEDKMRWEEQMSSITS
jgi:ankyrin repeat protein